MLSDSRVRYVMVGGAGATIEYLVFTLVDSVGVDVLIANAISFCIGLILTFALHNIWSFSGEKTYDTSTQFASYVLLAGLNLLLSTILIGWMVHGAHIHPLIAKATCMMMIVLWNYLLLNKIIFKR